MWMNPIDYEIILLV